MIGKNRAIDCMFSIVFGRKSGIVGNNSAIVGNNSAISTRYWIIAGNNCTIITRYYTIVGNNSTVVTKTTLMLPTIALLLPTFYQ